MSRLRTQLKAVMESVQIVPVKAEETEAEPRRVLIYTHNGKGYVHENIQASVDAMTAIATHHGFQVDVSDDPAVFTSQNLKRYRVLIFSNTNNQAFITPEQREAFQHFIERGGGLIGIHSAAGSERDWPYFAHVLGGKFVEHPVQQTLTVSLADPTSKITKGLPESFEWDDECYFFSDSQPGRAKTLLTVDRSKLHGLEKMKLAHPEDAPALLPVAWYQSVDGGREFYMGLGHQPESYSDPRLVRDFESRRVRVGFGCRRNRLRLFRGTVNEVFELAQVLTVGLMRLISGSSSARLCDKDFTLLGNKATYGVYCRVATQKSSRARQMLRWVARAAWRTALGLLALVLLGCVVGEVHQRLLRHRAEKLLVDIHGLRLRESTWSDARPRLMTRWDKWGHTEGVYRKRLHVSNRRAGVGAVFCGLGDRRQFEVRQV